MARFDVYPNPVSAERRRIPYVLDVQNDYIDGLDSRVVIPLQRQAAFGPAARHLNPTLIVSEERVVLDTAALAAVPRSDLKKPVASVRDSRVAIQEALDALFGAY